MELPRSKDIMKSEDAHVKMSLDLGCCTTKVELPSIIYIYAIKDSNQSPEKVSHVLKCAWFLPRVTISHREKKKKKTLGVIDQIPGACSAPPTTAKERAFRNESASTKTTCENLKASAERRQTLQGPRSSN